MVQQIGFVLAGIFGVLWVMYTAVILRCRQAWQGLPIAQLPENNKPETPITVIIPVRNEAANIGHLLTDLAAQGYPHHLLEVIVADDHSTDNTGPIIRAFAGKAPFPVRHLPLADTLNGKKDGIKAAIRLARGELLAFTDGDCRVQPDWLLHLEFLYRQRGAKFISGPVAYHHPSSFFARMQVVEFASLVGVGAASLTLGSPNMCNGANLAYPKSVFDEVQGFAGNEHLASGDDEFLLHKVFKKYPASVFFIKAPGATVFTGAQPDVAAFVAQRVRWASKWPAYDQAGPRLLALLVFGINLVLLLGFGAWPAGAWSGTILACTTGLKLLTDALFLLPVLRFFNQNRYWPYILALQLVYVPYVVLTALLSWRKSYRWKGRQVQTLNPLSR